MSSSPPPSSSSSSSSSSRKINESSQSVTTLQQDSTGGVRKRTCKACDRCRMKKTKCDGISPCARCKRDNAICVSEKRKRPRDRIYPKGYVAILEQQQAQIVTGLQELYRRLLKVSAWEGSPLEEVDGVPLTHDILSALNLLETEHCHSGDLRYFEENCEQLQWIPNVAGAALGCKDGLLDLIPNRMHCEHSCAVPRQQPSDKPNPESLDSAMTSSPLAQGLLPQSKKSAQPPEHAVQPEFSSLPEVISVSPHNDPQIFTPTSAQAFVTTTASERLSTCDGAIQHWGSDVLLSCPWTQQLPQCNPLGTQFPSNPIEPSFDINGGDPTVLGLLDDVGDDFDKFIGQYESGLFQGL